MVKFQQQIGSWALCSSGIRISFEFDVKPDLISDACIKHFWDWKLPASGEQQFVSVHPVGQSQTGKLFLQNYSCQVVILILVAIMVVLFRISEYFVHIFICIVLYICILSGHSLFNHLPSFIQKRTQIWSCHDVAKEILM